LKFGSLGKNKNQKLINNDDFLKSCEKVFSTSKSNPGVSHSILCFEIWKFGKR